MTFALSLGNLTLRSCYQPEEYMKLAPSDLVKDLRPAVRSYPFRPGPIGLS